MAHLHPADGGEPSGMNDDASREAPACVSGMPRLAVLIDTSLKVHAIVEAELAYLGSTRICQGGADGSSRPPGEKRSTVATAAPDPFGCLAAHVINVVVDRW